MNKEKIQNFFSQLKNILMQIYDNINKILHKTIKLKNKKKEKDIKVINVKIKKIVIKNDNNKNENTN